MSLPYKIFFLINIIIFTMIACVPMTPIVEPMDSSPHGSRIVPGQSASQCFQEQRLPRIPRQACAVDLQNLQAHYEGQCKNGKANGVGLAVGKDIYEGEFVNGLPEGSGVLTWVDKQCFIGHFKNGVAQVPHTGCEVIDVRLRGRYTGECGNNRQANGQGKTVGIDTYEGSFSNAMPNGQGTYMWANGDRFIGQFKNGKMHGRGVMKHIAGGEQAGKWNNGQLAR